MNFEMPEITGETIEGSWEEIARLAPKLNGHRLRVTILPAAPLVKPNPFDAPTGRAVAYLRARLAQEATDDPEEIRQAEEDLEEMKRHFNENRRREGAEAIF